MDTTGEVEIGDEVILTRKAIWTILRILTVICKELEYRKKNKMSVFALQRTILAAY